jgi:hypothetical protein
MAGNTIDLRKLTGEELCEFQGVTFEELLRVQNNLRMVAQELERRKTLKAVEPKVEPTGSTEKE